MLNELAVGCLQVVVVHSCLQAVKDSTGIPTLDVSMDVHARPSVCQQGLDAIAASAAERVRVGFDKVGITGRLARRRPLQLEATGEGTASFGAAVGSSPAPVKVSQLVAPQGLGIGDWNSWSTRRHGCWSGLGRGILSDRSRGWMIRRHWCHGCRTGLIRRRGCHWSWSGLICGRWSHWSWSRIVRGCWRYRSRCWRRSDRKRGWVIRRCWRHGCWSGLISGRLGYWR